MYIKPILLHESSGVIRAIEILKQSTRHLLVIGDDRSTVKGVVAPIDIFEAIAGEFPDQDETNASNIPNAGF